MTAYALLAEEFYQKECKVAFLTSNKKSYEIQITDYLVEKLQSVIINISDILSNGNKPYSSASDHQCVQCEYYNFCNDC